MPIDRTNNVGTRTYQTQDGPQTSSRATSSTLPAMTREEYQKGLNDVIAYFENGKTHISGDKAHISYQELRDSLSNLSAEGQKLVKSIMFDKSLLDGVREVQTEGWFNDKEISMRDLYALRRGTGYNGGDISERVGKVTNRLNIVQAGSTQNAFRRPGQSDYMHQSHNNTTNNSSSTTTDNTDNYLQDIQSGMQSSETDTSTNTNNQDQYAKQPRPRR